MSDTPPMPPPPPPSDWEDSEEILPELPEFLPPPDMGDEANNVESELQIPLPPCEEAETPKLQQQDENIGAAASAPELVTSPPSGALPLPVDEAKSEQPSLLCPPPPISDEESAMLPPLPPQDATGVRKGTGLAVALGIAAFFAAAMGFQNQSGNVQLKREIADINSRIEQETTQQAKYAAELRDIENCEQQINEADAGLKKQQEEYNSLTAEIAELQRYSRPRVLASDKGQLQDSIAVLQRQSAELDALLEMYLPPTELSEEKLLKRDIYIRKFALLYNEAWNSRAWNIMGVLYADYVHHQLTGNNSASVRRVLQTLISTKAAAPGELRAIGYNGLHIELLYKSRDENSDLWYRENMSISEQGRIFRWNEEVIKDEQPSLSAGFRSVPVTPQEK